MPSKRAISKDILEKMTFRYKPRWISLFHFTTKKHIPTLFLALLCALLASLTTLIFAIIIGNIFNSFMLFGAKDISDKGLIEDITKSCVALAALGAAGWVLNGGYFTFFVTFGELQLASARTRLFEKLLRRDLEWFEGQQDGIGAFLSSTQSQLHDLQTATSQPLGLVLHYSFRSVASLILAFYTSWKLSLITLAGIPICSAFIIFLSSKIHPKIEAQLTELSHASKIANSAITSIDTVKFLNGQMLELQKFTRAIDRAATYYLKQARLNSLQIAIVRLMMFGMFVQGFWYGCLLASSGKLTPGNVLRTFWACLTAAQSIELVMPQVMVLEKGQVAAVALKDVLERSADTRPGEVIGTMCPRFCEGDIEVSDLSFAYPSQPDRLALNESSFFFPAGETTFVIGKSGSGKSTLGQLLTRFYTPNSGDILIDGIPIQSISIDWIRNNITYVEQRSVLFNESIFKNIAFGSRDYEQVKANDVQNCIDLAMLQGTIENLPNGIDTCVGYGGNFLSGGQRQRVAIARARLRDTPILILDEPTSALDGTNRVAIMKAIREWRKGKTTIVITHDLSQISEKDFIYVLDQSSVVQAGYKFELGDHISPITPGGHISNDAQHALDKDDYSDYSDCLSTSSDDSYTAADLSKHVSISEAECVYEPHPEPRDSQANRWSIPWRRRTRPSTDSITSPAMYELNTIRVESTITVDHHPKPTSPKNKKARIPRTTHPLPRQTRKPAKQPTTTSPYKTSITQILLAIIPALTIKQRFVLALGFLCALAHAFATPAFSYCLSQLFGAFYTKTSTNQVAMKWALAVLGVAIGDGTVSYFMHYFLETCGQAWVDGLRKKGFHRVLDQPKTWFEEDRNTPSQLIASLDQNGEDLRNIIGRFAGFIVVAVTISIVAVIWSFAICWKLTAVALACGPIVYAVTRGFEGTSGLWERRCNEAHRNVSDIFVETFSEIRTVRTLTLESFFHKKHVRAAARCTTMGLKRAGYTGFLFGLVESNVIFVSALIFYYGAVLVSSYDYTVDNITTVFSMLLFSIGYASTVMSWIPQISTSQEKATQLLRLTSLPSTSHEHLGTVRITKATPLKLNHVNFRYPSRPTAPVLKDVSITIPQDSCTAIVGRSGSGKSTIASLLLALYEAPLSRHGLSTVSVGGIDIRYLHTATLRGLISVVSQQPMIFPGSIQGNISYGLDERSPLSTLHNVRAAARAAGIDDFISSLPNGYNTVIGEGGIGLSGGQAQRLVIARALVRRPQVLILDEATSSLDAGSAKIIRQTVQGLVAAQLGLTVIIISHAKEMIEICDHVVVLDQGSVVEEGGYYELVAKGGKLSALVDECG